MTADESCWLWLLRKRSSIHCTVQLLCFNSVLWLRLRPAIQCSGAATVVWYHTQIKRRLVFFYLFTIVLLFIWTKLYFVTLKRRTAPTMPNLLSRLRSYATVVPVSFLCSTGYFTDAVDSRDKRASIRSCFIRTWWQPDYETLAVMELVVISRE